MTTTSDLSGLRSPAVEDYAKAIYALQMRDEQPVSTTALAERLGVTAASASGMVKRLGELGLVTHRRYHGGLLTDAGLRVALEGGGESRLGELGLVTHRRYHGVLLTDAGLRVALEVIRHHRLLELYLVESLGVPGERVH